jgi:hypothetical protein
MSALEQLWNGISPCMEPGVGDCVVWWDAWAVAVALLGICVAALGVLVAGVSAAAVFWLGKQANSVATVGLNNGIAERIRLNNEADARMGREEKVLLCFLSAELDQARIKMNTVNQLLQSEEFNIDAFVANAKMRKILAERAGQVKLEKLHSVVGRLHAIEASTGMRLGRLAGDVAVLQRHLSDLANVNCDHEGQAAERVEQKKELLRAGHLAMKEVAARAASDSAFLGLLTTATAARLAL